MAWIVNEDNLADMYLNLTVKAVPMISAKGCWKLELWISESRKKADTLQECKVSAFLFLEDS